MSEQPLVNLFVKLAVSASLASILVRFRFFKRLLMVEERTLAQRLWMAFSIAAVFGGAVAVRVITGTYKGADVGLEGSFIAGLVGGYVPGLVCGTLISAAPMFHAELLSMPLFAAVGVLGGMLRDVARDPESIYSISPFPDRNVYRAIRYWRDDPRSWFHAFLFLTIPMVELLRLVGSRVFGPRAVFTMYPEPGSGWAAQAAVWAASMFAVLLPIKIWANARTEIKLADQLLMLQEARLRALMSQINPHFLFNTLNSVASLVRTNPDQARVVIHKLSSILRKLMRKHDNFTSLREELQFIDDYLSIEMVRFGDKLKFYKEVEAETLEAKVPSMLLQPIVENSLKHGLATKVEGGWIRLRAWRDGDRLHLEVSDDGVGIPEANLAKLFEQGIGVSNVNERLKVLFGSDYKMWIDSKQGEGTRTGIEIPGREPGLARAS
ncbi:MAG: histidine kinase [Bryobacteraceae bacterium]